MTISTAFDLLNMAAPQQTFLKTSNAKETSCMKKNNVPFYYFFEMGSIDILSTYWVEKQRNLPEKG